MKKRFNLSEKIKEMKLNIGSGMDYKEGYVNLDYNINCKPDMIWNLTKLPLPFTDNEFEEVYCSHILEHVDNLFNTINELVRITKNEGIIHVKVPHFSNGIGYNDLTHKRFFGWFTFIQMIKGYYNMKFNFKITSQRFNFLAVNHPIANKMFSWFYNLLPKQFYERFLCWIFPVGEIELKLEVVK